jgi:hypothetical protein
MTDNPQGYDPYGNGLPLAFVAGAALGLNSALNDRDASAGYVPSWPRRHPLLYLAVCWIGCALAIIAGAVGLFGYAMLGSMVDHFYPGHTLQIGIFQILLAIWFIGRWRYLLAERRWNPTEQPRPGQWQ